MPLARTATTALAVLAAVTGVAACGGSDDGASAPAPSTSVGAPSTTTTSPDGTASAPAVTPAAGPRLQTDHLGVRLPTTGWRLSRQQATFQKTGFGSGSQEIDIGDLPTIEHTFDLDALAKVLLHQTCSGRGRVRDQVLLDGTEWAHVSCPVAGLQVDDYATYVQSDVVSVVDLSFQLDPQLSDAERRAVIDPVLATVRLTE